MYLSNNKTIVFITGAFISHLCWEKWIVFFESHGYKTTAPPWPYKNESPPVLRKKDTAKIISNRLGDLLDYYTETIETLSEKPILIGHGYGGLVTQLLVQKDLALCAVCIHSFSPQNIWTGKFSFYNRIRNSLGLFTSSQKSYLITFKEWQELFVNCLLIEEQKNAYAAYVIPESKLIIRDLYSAKAKINFRKPHVPLLFLAGSDDKLIPQKLIYTNFKKYRNLHSITCYKECKNTNHLVLIQSNWKETADCIVDWLYKIV
ncbi:alpha/beta hydrolase [Flavobacterium hungaricum]|uniref:Alpha/beta hydrolase n=1 Tax=Flavobacterium hungaricum TaxID=2082725 RepID=A0ABR9TKP7_9FLAO|nr:alpha/beta hydrolase [Flavobacterium hungaricum]MBE8725941.1 alpha/beta hydrolase [Flavobacterium hungaricum]